MHQGFRLIIQLKTPAIVSPMLTLDAILAAALFRETGDVKFSHESLPLARKDGCWCGSTVQFERGAFTHLNWLGKLTTRDLNEERFTDRDRKGRAMAKTNGGLYAASIESHRAWAGSVSFLGYGDPDEVVRLISTLNGIGAKTQQGCGEIDAIEWARGDTNGLWSTDQQRPLRPVPLPVWKSWGMAADPDLGVDMVSWNPPYWGSPKALCVLPVTVS